MADFGETPGPELKEYSLENFGYILRDSASLSPDVFPYKVGFSKRSKFFQSIFEGLYKGKDTTVTGSNAAIRPKGVFVEHEAMLAANDLGEIMVSKEVFEGNMSVSRTDKSDLEYKKYYQMLHQIKFPPGWRVFGSIHSHPIDDVINESGLYFVPFHPRINELPLTWSGGDYNSFMAVAKQGFNSYSTLGLINQNQLSFMVASNLTVEMLNSTNKETRLKCKAVNRGGLPPYKLFKELGIILCAGIHNTGKNDKVLLERLY